MDRSDLCPHHVFEMYDHDLQMWVLVCGMCHRRWLPEEELPEGDRKKRVFNVSSKEG